MADNVAVTAGSGTSMASDEIGGVHYQRVKIGLGADGSAVDAIGGSGAVSAAVQRVVLATDVALPAGTNAIGKLAANSGVDIGDVDVTSVIPGTSATSLGKAEDDAHVTGDVGVMMLTVRKNTAAATSGSDGDYQPPITDTNGKMWVNASGETLTVGTHAVTISSGGVASGAIASGAVASGAFASGSIGSGAVASGAIASGAFASGSISAGAVAAGASSFVKLEDAASADADAGVPAMAIRKATPANTSGTDGDYEMLQMSAGRLWTSATIDSALPAGSNSIGAVTNTYLTQFGTGSYETVAASQTDQVLGSTGATGDYLAAVLIIPATTSPGAVSIKDGSGSAITIFTGGASSVSNLVPFSVPLGIVSTGGAWKVTTGANVSAIGSGKFT